jgi:hypothetical protein
MPTDTIRSGTWYVERKLDTTIPSPPKVDMRRKPIEEQQTHVLDKMLKPVPENNDDLLIPNFECFIIYVFMLTKTPSNMELMLVRMKLMVASSGK